MNFKTHIFSILIAFLFFLFLGCSDHRTPSKDIKKACLPKHFVTEQNLGSALTVKEVRESNKTANEFVVEGFIGGRKKPFTEQRAVFILGDDSLQTCDRIPGDNCPTPWDVCCEDRKKVASSTIAVQVLESNGSLLIGTLEGVAGLKPGTKVRVKGRLDEKSRPHSLIINAKNIQLLAQ